MTLETSKVVVVPVLIVVLFFHHMICAPTKFISKPGLLTYDSHYGTRRSKKKLHQPGCTSQLVSVGQRSANPNPSRCTISPTVTEISVLNSGHRKQNVWNSPHSPQGSTPAGNSAKRAIRFRTMLRVARMADIGSLGAGMDRRVSAHHRLTGFSIQRLKHGTQR